MAEIADARAPACPNSFGTLWFNTWNVRFFVFNVEINQSVRHRVATRISKKSKDLVGSASKDEAIVMVFLKTERDILQKKKCKWS